MEIGFAAPEGRPPLPAQALDEPGYTHPGLCIGERHDQDKVQYRQHRTIHVYLVRTPTRASRKS
jgi:hypothetical protein